MAEIDEQYMFELSSIIENAPYMLENGYGVAYAGKSNGSSSSSSHSASRAEASSIPINFYVEKMGFVGAGQSQNPNCSRKSDTIASELETKL